MMSACCLRVTGKVKVEHNWCDITLFQLSTRSLIKRMSKLQEVLIPAPVGFLQFIVLPTGAPLTGEYKCQ